MVAALESLLEDETAGDPITGLKWTHKTPEKLSRALGRRGFRIGRTAVRRLMREQRYRLRVNRKERSRQRHPERNRQMKHIARQRRAFLRAGFPVISVDTKKKELIGDFRNPGRTWRRAPREVWATDFLSDAVGKAIPYGLYDLRHNAGWLAVGVSHETAAFALQTIRTWWRCVGSGVYPRRKHLLILADGGGANGSGCWQWKQGLQGLANEFGLTITVMHYPPGASKWNPIEHRMFGPISSNWQGHPLVSYAVMLKLIRAAKTKTGFTCRAYLDKAEYPTKLKVPVVERAQINLVSHRVRPNWNYTIKPHPKARKTAQVISG